MSPQTLPGELLAVLHISGASHNLSYHSNHFYSIAEIFNQEATSEQRSRNIYFAKSFKTDSPRGDS